MQEIQHITRFEQQHAQQTAAGSLAAITGIGELERTSYIIRQ